MDDLRSHADEDICAWIVLMMQNGASYTGSSGSPKEVFWSRPTAAAEALEDFFEEFQDLLSSEEAGELLRTAAQYSADILFRQRVLS